MNLPIIQYNIRNQQHTVVVGDGVLNNFDDWFKKTLGERRYILVCEPPVQHYGAHLNPYHTHIIQGSERCKSWKSLQFLCDSLIPYIDRSTVLVALGGGAIGDLVGFAASILLRGIDWVFIPTTLLSQVDSSIGGKTAINSSHGKNLIGTFHPAKLVMSDTNTLCSLSHRQLLSGYVEIFKHALIADQNLVSKLEKLKPSDFKNVNTLAPFIHRSVELKLNIIDQDWFENTNVRRRMLLNLGHTFGHAFEHLPKSKLLHGEAVAIGIVLSYKISAHLGICSNNDVKRVEEHFDQLKIKTSPQTLLKKFSASEVINKIMVDKKKQNDFIKFILPKGIGQGCEIPDFTTQHLEGFLKIYSEDI